jgi:hypothetical protein
MHAGECSEECAGDRDPGELAGGDPGDHEHAARSEASYGSSPAEDGGPSGGWSTDEDATSCASRSSADEAVGGTRPRANAGAETATAGGGGALT